MTPVETEKTIREYINQVTHLFRITLGVFYLLDNHDEGRDKQVLPRCTVREKI
jgi:hypothetical protein